MRPSMALSIGAVFHVLVGLPLLIAPAQFATALGLADAPTIALVWARDIGTLALGVAVIDWLARDAVGAPLRGLLWGNIFIRVAAMVVNSWELAIGQIPSAAAAAFPFLLAINLALIIVFALALRRAWGT
jgi:hypothetical protein